MTERRPEPRRPRSPGRPQRSRQTPAERGRSGDPARLAAYTVMRAVADGGYANIELPKELRRRHLRGRDAAFATELTYGATRLRGFYDPVIALAADRPVSRIDGSVLDTLRLGAHQLLGMRVPAHAAADETVALARAVNGAGASGLVNAVMRRISEADRDAWLARVLPPEHDAVERLAIAHSHPVWIVKALRQALLGHGASTPATADADLGELLSADNAPPDVQLVGRPGLCDPLELIEAGARPHRHVRTAFVLTAGDPGAIGAIREGRAAVQDAGSQLVALALAAAPRSVADGGPAGGRGPGGRERWLDLCAGPGGKAGLLAALAAERGADLVANEVAPHRADLVARTLVPAAARARDLGLALEVRTGDGREVGGVEPAAYDRILVDAPCTGLGALRRRPEARWRRTPQDLASLGVLQRALLTSALAAVAPGGIVAYATCSPHLAETTFVVADVLKRHPDVDQFDARPVVAEVTDGWAEALGAGPAVQLWPHVHGTDGMFLALLRRRR
ncbi:MAG: transcription antitermination factor NusB [Dermatophilaceae bacterium]